MAESINISRLLKYCLEYVRLTTRSVDISRLRHSYELSPNFLPLKDLLSTEDTDLNDGKGTGVLLPNFYDIDPKDVIPEKKALYQIEKLVAEKLEDIMNTAKNDMYTKELTLAFGHFEIELPLDQAEAGETADDIQQEQLFTASATTKIFHPLYSLPVKLEKHNGKYFLQPSDTQIRVNTSALFEVLGDQLYFQFVADVGKLEDEDTFELPVKYETLTGVWNKLREYLRLTKANFNDSSFRLDNVRIGLAPRVNYFLSEDLNKLAKLEQAKIAGTALSGWSDEDKESDTDLPGEGELYFPFTYDRWQLNTLKLLNRRIAIIEGPPGTGKSQTISNLLCHLAAKGKRVLFVSQKAQALKVVKDKLKETNIQFLFGYIPNMHSELLQSEDETDGIAPQLASLSNYLNKIEAPRAKQRDSDVVAAASDKKDAANSFNTAMTNQREYHRLTTAIEISRRYDLIVPDPEPFLDAQTPERLEELLSSEQRLDDVSQMMVTLDADTDLGQRLMYFEKKFGHITNWAWVHYLEEILKDIGTTGYDGNFTILNWFNNTTRKFRKSTEFQMCPREIRNEIDRILGSGRTLSLNIKDAKTLERYTQLQRYKSEKTSLEVKVSDLLLHSGLNTETWTAIKAICDKNSVKETAQNIQNIIRLKQQRDTLKIHRPDTLLNHWRKTEETRTERVCRYIQNLINPRLVKSYESQKVRKIIETFAKHLKKSKKAFKTFDRIRREKDAFQVVLSLVPVWLMELDDASRIVPLEPGIFDYVIFDEASQCNLAFAMPAMFRAQRALFVGDSYQMRDDSIRFKSNRAFDEIARRFDIPNDLRIKTTGESVQSVLDIARSSGYKSVTLRNHYRSPRELIGFSNKYFYKPNGRELFGLNNDYRIYKDSGRIIVLHPVKPIREMEISDKTNYAEALKAVALVKELRSTYRDLSIGVLSFFNAQASLIRQMAEKEKLDETRDNFKIATVEGIQGDEKDIIIYSFVISSPDQKNRYIALTGERGEINSLIAQGRVNVAFSRARKQVHCLSSLPIENFPDGIWLKKYLVYARDEGSVNHLGDESCHFDSNFEREVHALLSQKLPKHFLIRTQIKSCGFKIDQVVYNTNTGEKLAIECDGPTHFKDELDEESGIYVESDIERQATLESAGWRFLRILYSDWINLKYERGTIANSIIERLESKIKKTENKPIQKEVPITVPPATAGAEQAAPKGTGVKIIGSQKDSNFTERATTPPNCSDGGITDELNRRYGLRTRDMRDKGGALWVDYLVDHFASHDKIANDLIKMGFRFTPGKGYWRK